MDLTGCASDTACHTNWHLPKSIAIQTLRGLLVMLLATLCACQAPELPLRVAMNLWPGYQPLHLAESQGYFGSVPVRLVNFSSSTEYLRAFRNGDVEVAALTLDEVLLLQADGHDIRVILIMDFSQGADAIVSRPEFPDLPSLKGRRIGVERSAVGAYVLSRAFSHFGMSPQDIQIVNLTIDRHEQAYKDGQVDAIVTFEPTRTHLLNLGAREIFNSAQIPGEILDTLAVRGDILKTRSHTLTKLLQGWFKSITYAAAEPTASNQLMAQWAGLSEEDYARALSGIRFPSLTENCQLLAENNATLNATAASLRTVMLENRLLLSTSSTQQNIFAAGPLSNLDCENITQTVPMEMSE